MPFVRRPFTVAVSLFCNKNRIPKLVVLRKHYPNHESSRPLQYLTTSTATYNCLRFVFVLVTDATSAYTPPLQQQLIVYCKPDCKPPDMLKNCPSMHGGHRLDLSTSVTSLRPAQNIFCGHQPCRRQRLTVTDTWRCSAQVSSSLQKTAVVEYLLLLQAPTEADPESVEAMLDSLWSVQYMIPSVLYAAAGRVSQCNICSTGQQLSANSNIGSHHTSQSAECSSYTHAVHLRLSDQLALAKLQKHPIMSQALEQVRQICSCSAHVVFEGSVAKQLEAIFRRGDEYATGIEHVLLMQQSRLNGGVGAATFLQKLGDLAESPVAGGIQASYGKAISVMNSTATHVLMTRFESQQQVQRFLQSPACAAVMQNDPRLPVTAAVSLCISVQPAEESTKVNGIGDLSL